MLDHFLDEERRAGDRAKKDLESDMSKEPSKSSIVTPSDPQETASEHLTQKTKATTMRAGDVLPGIYPASIPESKSSVASTYTGKELKIEVPSRPKGEDGYELEDFECPYCLLYKTIRTERQWK